MDTQAYDWKEVMMEPLWLPICCPKKGFCNGNQPNCANSSSRDGNRCLALVPKPCNMTGRIKPGSISIAWYILSPGSTLIATSPGRRLSVGRAPCS